MRYTYISWRSYFLDMVSSIYSEAGFRTGDTSAMKFTRGHEKCMKFDFKVLQPIAHRLYRLPHGKLHDFAQNLEQIGSLRKKVEHFGIGRP